MQNAAGDIPWRAVFGCSACSREMEGPPAAKLPVPAAIVLAGGIMVRTGRILLHFSGAATISAKPAAACCPDNHWGQPASERVVSWEWTPSSRSNNFR